MGKVLGLTWAYLRARPVRNGLAALATVCSVCMVVWVASGYDALLKTFDNFAERGLGRYELSVAAVASATAIAVPDDALDALRSDPAVTAVEPMGAKRAPVAVKTRGPGVPEPAAPSGPQRPLPDPMILATDVAEAPFSILRGRWIEAASEAVLSDNAAARLGVDVGGELLAGQGRHRQLLRVVGVLDAPDVVVAYDNTALKVLCPGAGDVFVRMEAAASLHGSPVVINFAGVAVADEVDVNTFRFAWGPRLSGFATPLQFQEAFDIEEALDESASAENIKLQSYAATALSMLVSLLVIFCTLNMGVSERIRQFAILRSLRFTRGQVVGLVVLESLFLASIGLAGGLALGYGALQALEQGMGGLLRHGATLGGHSLTLATVAAYGGALLASTVPAWRAVRVRPVDALAGDFGDASSGPGRAWSGAAGLGLGLLAVNPVLAFLAPPDFDAGIYLAMAVGYGCMCAGLLLLAPAVVSLADRAIGPLLARLLGIQPRLLFSQVSSHRWRTVGAALSMTVGLGLFVAVQVWGHTMLGAFVPGAWVPDAIVYFSPDGVPPAQAAEVGRLPGVDPARTLPVVVEQPMLAEDITGSAENASVVRQNNVVIAGVDPARALLGARPLLPFDWVEGSPEEAARRLAAGRACVVPDHFLREAGLQLGDSFAMVPPEAPDQPVHYEIVGAVRLPGWHWQTKHTSFRTRNHRAAALIFAGYAAVAADFDLPRTSHVWFGFSDGADPLRIEAEAAKLYGALLGREATAGIVTDGSPYARVITADAIRAMTLQTAGRWLWVISVLPLIALVVACFGVLNVMLASVRARYWEMGVLRGLGFTRFSLIRAIVAEGLLIGVIACVFSVAFGVLAGWCGAGYSQHISFFGGMHPPLALPVLPVLIGLVFALGLSGLTALWPALSIARTRPLTLLQRGRGGS